MIMIRESRRQRHERLKRRERMKEVGRFIEARDAALMSYDEDKIRAWMAEYRIEAPSDEAFWVTVHKAIAACSTIWARGAEGQQCVERSRAWLSIRGYSWMPGAEEGKSGGGS